MTINPNRIKGANKIIYFYVLSLFIFGCNSHDKEQFPVVGKKYFYAQDTFHRDGHFIFENDSILAFYNGPWGFDTVKKEYKIEDDSIVIIDEYGLETSRIPIIQQMDSCLIFGLDTNRLLCCPISSEEKISIKKCERVRDRMRSDFISWE